MGSINWLTFDVPILEVNILDVNIVTNMSKVWKPDVVIAHIGSDYRKQQTPELFYMPYMQL